MGCNASKSQDIQKDRERVSQQHTTAAATGTPSRGIGTGKSDKQEENYVLGTSYTDQRMMHEEDFYREIIDRTAQNFIDISQTSAVDVQDTSRSKAYAAQLTNAAFDDRTAAVFALPAASDENEASGAIVQILSAPVVVPQRQAVLREVLSKVVQSVEETSVQDVGELVVSFPDME